MSTISCFMRPSRRAFCRVQFDTVVKTLEGQITVPAGHVILTGSKDEKYPIAPDTFARTYKVLEEVEGEGFAESVPEPRFAEQVHEAFSCEVPWSKEPMFGKPGDYRVWSQTATPWVVEQDIFKDTYQVL
jgi:hypothetical protein